MKTAIFLGAGASASEGAPLQNKLFFEYFNNLGKKDRYAAQNMEKELETFFSLMFDIDVNVIATELEKLDFPTFEEALSILDLASLRHESFREYSQTAVAVNSGRLERMRLYLILLMAEVLNDRLQTSRERHKKLVETLCHDNKIKDVVFLSTNYDILIDNALVELYQSHHISLDYGLDFVNFSENDNWKKPNINSVQLFKIHGSLNWLYCPTCNSIRLTPKEKGVIKLIGIEGYEPDKFFCKTCKTVFSPIIVPPTYYKDFTNIFLSTVWNKAEQSLLNTDHIIFCGYSFPDADMHVKYLLKRIQKNRDVFKRLKFSVVNGHLNKTKLEKDDERRRFQRFLGEKVNYTDLSFEQFSENPGQLIS